MIDRLVAFNFLDHTRQLFAGYGGYKLDLIIYQVSHYFFVYRHNEAYLGLTTELIAHHDTASLIQLIRDKFVVKHLQQRTGVELYVFHGDAKRVVVAQKGSQRT